MVADMHKNKKLSSILADLFLSNVESYFSFLSRNHITQASKDFVIMKIPNK